MRYFFFVIFCLLLFPFVVSAAITDLALEEDSVSFSKETLVAGDTLRIYAIVTNVGDLDVSGYVSFYQGSLPISDSQVISSRAGGSSEEVFVDFVVPSGSFNIRAEIRGTDPEDENSANDILITRLFTPILDDDRDGVENDEDNCPSVENNDQFDNDVDGSGDVCDDDDDDDSVTDGVESEIGTNPKDSDSDDDGLSDNSDPRPTVAGSQNEAAAESPSFSEENVGQNTNPDSTALSAPESSGAVVEETTSEAGNSLSVSPNVVFSYQQEDWGVYLFRARLPAADGYRVSWDFGDGATSSKEEVEHEFSGAGEYKVTIKIESDDGQISEDSTTIKIPFFSLENQIIQFLTALLIFLLAFAIFLFKKTWTPRTPPLSRLSPHGRRGSRKIFVRSEDNEQ